PVKVLITGGIGTGTSTVLALPPATHTAPLGTNAGMPAASGELPGDRARQHDLLLTDTELLRAH
ncbi:hypothetical protein ABLN67_10190, partial [Mycobacterium tuberculosis]